MRRWRSPGRHDRTRSSHGAHRDAPVSARRLVQARAQAPQVEHARARVAHQQLADAGADSAHVAVTVVRPRVLLVLGLAVVGALVGRSFDVAIVVPVAADRLGRAAAQGRLGRP